MVRLHQLVGDRWLSQQKAVIAKIRNSVRCVAGSAARPDHSPLARNGLGSAVPPSLIFAIGAAD
jgi:hypothetical protein